MLWHSQRALMCSQMWAYWLPCFLACQIESYNRITVFAATTQLHSSSLTHLPTARSLELWMLLCGLPVSRLSTWCELVALSSQSLTPLPLSNPMGFHSHPLNQDTYLLVPTITCLYSSTCALTVLERF